MKKTKLSSASHVLCNVHVIEHRTLSLESFRLTMVDTVFTIHLQRGGYVWIVQTATSSHRRGGVSNRRGRTISRNTEGQIFLPGRN